jgi:hypothetical protein
VTSAAPAARDLQNPPSIGIMTAVFEDNFDRKPAVPPPVVPPSTTIGADAAASLADAGFGLNLSADGGRAARVPYSLPDGGPGLASLGADAGVEPFNEIGPDWTPTDPAAWHLEKGKLCGSHARNHGIWLNRVLPVNARIEFDATAETEEGDLKGEFWGDGRSFATSLSYTNATGYLAIMGGWHNTFHVLARHNEHGSDRKEIKIDKTSDDPEEKPVEPGQVYRFKVERTDGKTVKFSINGVEFLNWPDDAPIKGAGHDHFAFNDWDAKVCFDNLKVTPLP